MFWSRVRRWQAVLALLAAIILGGSTLPAASPALAASPATPPVAPTTVLADRSWSVVAFPGSGSSNVLSNVNIRAIAVSPNFATDSTVFALIDTNGDLMAERIAKSANGGKTWTVTPTAGLTGVVDMRAIAISPNFATDSAVVVADPTRVFRSNNGGTSYQQLGGAVVAAPSAITSIAISPDGTLVAAGIADTTGGAMAVNGVLAWGLSGALDWSNPATNALNEDVTAVAFSPGYSSDGTILAVGSNVANGTRLHARKGSGNVWDSAGGPQVISASVQELGGVQTGAINAPAISNVVRASLAIPTDFTVNNTSNLATFVGLATADFLTTNAAGAPWAGTAVERGGVYRAPAITGTVNAQIGAANSLATAADVASLSLAGSNAAPGTLFVGMSDNQVRRSTTHLGSVANIAFSAATNRPSFGAPTIDTVVAATPNFATSTTVFAANSLAAAAKEETGFSVSRDGGANFTELSLMDVDRANITDIETAGATIYVATTGAGNDSLWRSVDSGASWERVDAMETGALAQIALSPAYVTDGVVYWAASGLANGTMRRSTNSGASFTTPNANGAGIGVAFVDSILALDTNTLVVGNSDASLRRSVNQGLDWSNVTLPVSGTLPATRIDSIARSPNYSADTTVILGDGAGNVFRSIDGGATWARVGTAMVIGASADLTVAFDPAYATNGTFYVATNGGNISRWVNGVTTNWSTIIAPITSIETVAANVYSGDPQVSGYSNSRVVLSGDGVFYASTQSWGLGVRRSANPTARSGAPVDLATYPEFTNMDISLSYVLTSAFLGPIALSGTTVYAVNTAPATDTLLAFTDTWADPQPVPPVTSPAGDALAGSAPPGAVTVTVGSIGFTWPSVTGATLYQFQVASDPGFATIQDSRTVVGTGDGTSTSNATVALSVATRYWWRVRAIYAGITVNDVDAFSRWSQPPSFVTGGGAPPLVSPLMGNAGYSDPSVNPTFVWSMVNAATNYEIQVSTDPTFTDASQVAIDRTGANRLGNQLSYQDPAKSLLPGTTYSWRMRVYIAGGSITSSWGPPGTFRTQGGTQAITVFTGSVTVDGAPAPAGTRVSVVRQGGAEIGSGTTGGTLAADQYRVDILASSDLEGRIVNLVIPGKSQASPAAAVFLSGRVFVVNIVAFTVPQAVAVRPSAPSPVAPGADVIVAVRADNAENVAGMQLTLTYNPDHFTFKQAQPGSAFSACNLEPNTATAGSLGLAMACSDGHSGNGLEVIKVTLTAKAVAGPITSPLGIQNLKVGDAAAHELVSTPLTSVVIILQGRCGDMDASGAVTVVDVVALLRVSINAATASASQAVLGDLNRDGGINVLDAILGLMSVVGKASLDQCGPGA